MTQNWLVMNETKLIKQTDNIKITNVYRDELGSDYHQY